MNGRVIEFRTASVRVFEDRVETTFKEDGSLNTFYPPIYKADFVWAGIEMGYPHSDAGIMRYGLEHDITHHWLADELGWPHSWSIWSAAHAKPDTLPKPGQKWSQRVADEEHLVNRLQKYINTGELDTDYGVLAGTFGDKLPQVAGRLLVLLRPWITFPSPPEAC